MAKVGKNLQWHVTKLESAVTSERIALAHVHYALRADGQIIQQIVTLVMHEKKPRKGPWKIFKTKQKPEAILAELRGRGFEDWTAKRVNTDV